MCYYVSLLLTNVSSTTSLNFIDTGRYLSLFFSYLPWAESPFLLEIFSFKRKELFGYRIQPVFPN